MSEQTQTQQPSMQEEVLFGLRQEQKQLPSKYLYDERGSILFDQITELSEYYPTRTELGILQDNRQEIARLIGPGAVIIELGSGNSKKIRVLLKALPRLSAYIPVDISSDYLKKVAVKLHKDFPELLIKPVCADYTQRFKIPRLKREFHQQVLFFPGSTIGNFKPDEARRFLKTMASLIRKEAAMLIGVDLKKDKKVLELAYNDRQGLTAAFNKNLLVRLNREVDADFKVEQFTHHALYNEEKGRVEMHLIADRDQEVHMAGETFQFKKGETIHTENSYKYSLEEFAAVVDPWFSVEKVWTDANENFSLQYLIKK